MCSGGRLGGVLGGLALPFGMLALIKGKVFPVVFALKEGSCILKKRTEVGLRRLPTVSPPPARSACLLYWSLCLVLNAPLQHEQAAIDRSLPMYNVNPDITVNNPQGGLWYMPGLLAQRYEAMGGQVTYFGKPHKVISISISISRHSHSVSPLDNHFTVKPVA